MRSQPPSSREGRNECRVVDLVVLWVDGEEHAWKTRRQVDFDRWSHENPDELAIHGNTAGRFRDNDELRYNLRAIERFLTNVGHIYVITDDQRPTWLVPTDHLTIVDHSALAFEARGRIYDSCNIESYVHLIPGLAEHFIYLNDDVFFGQALDLCTWFVPHMTVYLESASVPVAEAPQRWDPAPVRAAAVAKQWLSAAYSDYEHVVGTFSHAPRPMRRSLTMELEAAAPALFSDVRSTTFRSWRSPSIVCDLVPRWMVHHGHAELQIFDSLYISTGSDEAAEGFLELTQRFGSIPFFCLNDTCDDADENDPRLLRVKATLELLLPNPSMFEAI